MPGPGLAILPLGYVFLVTYTAVLAAELVGDKSLYTVISLSLRFPGSAVLAGSAVAFGGKMLAAALLGKAVIHISGRWVGVVSAAAFFFSALVIWLKKPEPATAGPVQGAHWVRAAAASFGGLFFAEWLDPGQITAAALVARSHVWLPVWVGATLALVTKAGLAMTLGLRLRDWLPRQLLRPLASASCCLLGILTLARVLFA